MSTNVNDRTVLFDSLSIGNHAVASVTSASDGPWSVVSYTPSRTLNHVPTLVEVSNVLKTLINDLLIR